MNSEFKALSPYYHAVLKIGDIYYPNLAVYWIVKEINDDSYIGRDITKEYAYAKKKGFIDFNVQNKDIDRYIVASTLMKLKTYKEILDILICTGTTPLIYNDRLSKHLTDNNRYGKLLMKIRENEMYKAGWVRNAIIP